MDVWHYTILLGPLSHHFSSYNPAKYDLFSKPCICNRSSCLNAKCMGEKGHSLALQDLFGKDILNSLRNTFPLFLLSNFSVSWLFYPSKGLHFGLCIRKCININTTVNIGNTKVCKTIKMS